ncbi:MAG: hypothetical protein ACK2U1_17755 [Anaerolineales bacterium]
MKKFSQLLDKLSDYFAHRKGLLPILGIVLILLNWVMQFFPGMYGFAETNTLLHFGTILAIFGIMLAWVL